MADSQEPMDPGQKPDPAEHPANNQGWFPAKEPPPARPPVSGATIALRVLLGVIVAGLLLVGLCFAIVMR